MKLLRLLLSALMCSSVYAKKSPPKQPKRKEFIMNELETPSLWEGNCPYIALIYTRDTDYEGGNVGESGRALYKRLKKDSKKAPFRDNKGTQAFLKMQGVNYKQTIGLSEHHGVASYENPYPHKIPHPEAVRMTKDLVSHVVKTCNGRTNIVLAGYMRGVDVLRNITHSLTEAEAHEVMAVIAMSDSKMQSHYSLGERFAELEGAKVLEQCSKFDDFCHYTNTEVDELDKVHSEGDTFGDTHVYNRHWSKEAREFIFQNIKELRGDDTYWTDGQW